MPRPERSAHFANREASGIRTAQIRSLKCADRVETVHAAIGQATLSVHPGMVRLFRPSARKFTPSPLRICGAFLAVFLCACMSNLSAQEAALPRHLMIARDFVSNTMQKNNSYSNSHKYIEMPGDPFASKYVVHTDCVGFVESMFDRSKSGVLEQMRTRAYSKGYSLRDFYPSIAGSEAFTRLNKVVALQPGDVVMWLYVEHHQLPGHILFVDSAPVKIEPYRPIVDGLDQYAVWIIDTSQEAKSLDDTRYVADEKTRSENLGHGAEFGVMASPNYKGVGRGHIRLYADAAGELKGVAFGFPDSRFHPQDTDWRIVMGHPRVKGN